MFDFFGDGSNSYSLKNLNATLSENPNPSKITVHINSGGGLVSEGFAIYDKLISLNIPVTTIVEGMCGSIATVIAQAGKTGSRKMFQNSEYFIHNPLWIPQGPDAHNADDLEKLTGELRKSEGRLVDFYATVTGADKVMLADKMKAETTLTSQEAKDLGFIDEVINTNVHAMVRYQIAAAVVNPKQNNTMEDTKEIKTAIGRIEQLFTNFFKGKKVAVKTSEGVDIYYDGELDMGSKVYSNPEMTEPAPDGVHTVGGKVCTITAGEVTKIEDIEAAAPDATVALKEENTALKAQVETITAELQAANAEKAQFVAQVQTIQTEFVNFKSKIETGKNQEFNADGAEKKIASAAPKGTMADVVALRKAREEANKK
jgi:ATP-dependent Clp endopeptidase proteolytic subunit ClpP